ncbi:MAG: hypothetical protein HGA85_02715 [Nanoarchaeota archaeon]|nr:hypothetical protein [Nanoarchaeota archaeon]
MKPQHLILAGIFLLSVIVRTMAAASSEYFTSDTSYSALRQIEHIAETGRPLINDSLSYGGRIHILMPAYYYLLSATTLVFPGILAMKLVANLLASTIIIATYLLAYKLSKNNNVALACAFLSSIIPLYIAETINDIDAIAIVLPGSIFILYLFLSLEDNNRVLFTLVPLSLIVILTSASSLIVLFCLLAFIVICYLENIPIKRVQKEFIFFFFFFFFWSIFLIYKYAFQILGFSLIWQNTPSAIMDTYFKNIDLAQSASSIGPLLLLFGLSTIFTYLFRKKSKNAYAMISLFFISISMFWLRLVNAELGIVFIAESTILLFAIFIMDLYEYIIKTKLERHSVLILIGIFLLAVGWPLSASAQSVLDSLADAPTEKEISAFVWIKNTLPEDAVIMSPATSGNLITYFSSRKNIIDRDFLMVTDVDRRYEDVTKFYNVKIKVEAISILEKYGSEYVIATNEREKEIVDSNICMIKLFESSVNVYQLNTSLCSLKRI